MKCLYLIVVTSVLLFPVSGYEIGNRTGTNEYNRTVDNFSYSNQSTLFNGTHYYIPNNDIGVSNLSNYTLSMYAFVVANRDINMGLFGKDNAPIVQIRDCDIEIVPGKTYNMTAIINTSGKFVHCQEIVRGNNISEFTGAIDELRIYQKPLTIWERVKLFIYNLMTHHNIQGDNQ